MPIIMETRENGHFLYVKISDPWSLAELETMYRQEKAYRDEASFTMHAMVDFSELKKVPPSSITVGRRSPSLSHTRRGHLVLIGGPSFLQALIETIGRMTRAAKIKFVKSEEEGLVYLRRVIAEEQKTQLQQQSEDTPRAEPGSPA